MFASKEIQDDVNKVLIGKWTAFDFLLKYKEIESSGLLKNFYHEFNYEYQQAHLNNDVYVKFNPLCLENLDQINNHYRILLGKPTSTSLNANTSEKSERNPNHFNKECYDLFLYLVDNYHKKDKVKFINIFYYLTYYADKKTYHFKFTQNSYTAFVLKKYSIEPKSFKKEVFDNSSEKYTLSSHEEDFRRL
jgi:hypothetical protein